MIGGFTIQRATNSGFTQNLVAVSPAAGLPASTTSLVDTPLARNTRYYYRVQVFNGAGTSGWVSVNVRTPA
jgi:hypothetical protein